MINEMLFRVKKNGEPYSCCFCKKPELIENYNEAIADNTQTWDCHHKLETHNSDGNKRIVELSKKELIALDMYYNRPPDELIFLTTKEHHFLHRKDHHLSDVTKQKISEFRKGRCHSEETKKKMAIARKGKHHSEEARRRMSEAHKGKGHIQTEETRKKISETMKGKPAWNKGKHLKIVDGKRVF